MSTKTSGTSKSNVVGLVQISLFTAIIFIMAFTPFLGYIPLGATRATIIHIPVILGSLLLGPKKGAILGLMFGLTSFINNTINPTATSFVFTPFYSLGGAQGNLFSLVVCFVPRILIGIVPYYVNRLFLKLSKQEGSGTVLSLTLSGLAGALTNTILVMGFIFLFFADSYAAANNTTVAGLYYFILSIIGLQGVPEAIVAAILTVAVGKVMLKLHLGNTVYSN